MIDCENFVKDLKKYSKEVKEIHIREDFYWRLISYIDHISFKMGVPKENQYKTWGIKPMSIFGISIRVFEHNN